MTSGITCLHVLADIPLFIRGLKDLSFCRKHCYNYCDDTPEVRDTKIKVNVDSNLRIKNVFEPPLEVELRDNENTRSEEHTSELQSQR